MYLIYIRELITLKIIYIYILTIMKKTGLFEKKVLIHFVNKVLSERKLVPCYTTNAMDYTGHMQNT